MIKWKLPKHLCTGKLAFFCGKSQPQSDAIQNRWPDVEQRSTGDWRICHVVALVQNIFGGGKDFQIARHVTSDLQIHRVEAAERVEILIVIELVRSEEH